MILTHNGYLYFGLHTHMNILMCIYKYILKIINCCRELCSIFYSNINGKRI